jgi:hypothetical protein
MTTFSQWRSCAHDARQKARLRHEGTFRIFAFRKGPLPNIILAFKNPLLPFMDAQVLKDLRVECQRAISSAKQDVAQRGNIHQHIGRLIPNPLSPITFYVEV